MPSERSFLARARFRRAERPLYSGARPAVRFTDTSYTAEVRSADVDEFPWDCWVIVQVRVPFIDRDIVAGQSFVFMVGEREIGEGTVVSPDDE